MNLETVRVAVMISSFRLNENPPTRGANPCTARQGGAGEWGQM